jgi:CSLREA domain-containing protein
MSTIKNFVHKLFRYALVVTTALSFITPVSVSPALAQPAAVTFTVNTATDAHDSNPSDGTCYNGIDGCSLRAAIEQAFSVSNSGNPVTIHFWPDAGVLYNLYLGPLNLAADYVTVDGEMNGIIIDGSNLAAGQPIFKVLGSYNTLSRLTIRNAPTDGVQMGDLSGTGAGNYNTLSQAFVTGSGYSGVYVAGSGSGGSQSNAIQYSVVGASSWSATACTAGEGGYGDGIHIDAPSNNTIVFSNRIVCNTLHGINVSGSGSSVMNVQISNNEIGGYNVYDMGNGAAGIIDDGASQTTIHSNVIVGNGYDGVWLYNDDHATLTFNAIGVNSGGVSALGNYDCGVYLSGNAHNNTIGGTSAGDYNIISGNGLSGVCIEGGSYNNTVEGNLIGLNGSGTAAIPNAYAGVAINAANNNLIGTSAGGVDQFISGNTREGIWVASSSGTFIGQTNSIGVASDGVTPLGNGLEGVMLTSASNTSVFAAIVAYNGGAGVAVVGDSSVNNKVSIRRNYANGGLPVDLGNDGPTANGSHGTTGPNNWINYPVITAWSSTTIWGTACAGCTIYLYQSWGSTASRGGGGTDLNIFPEIIADVYGNWNATLPAGLTRFDISVVACAAPCGMTSNTSEMSPLGKLFLPMIRR